MYFYISIHIFNNPAQLSTQISELYAKKGKDRECGLDILQANQHANNMEHRSSITKYQSM